MRRITIRVSEAVHQDLQEEAESTDRRLSDVVRSRLADRRTGHNRRELTGQEKRTLRLPVYLNSNELEHVKNFARRRGLTASSFLRSLGLEHRLPPSLTVFQEIRTELIAQGNNLNQLAHLANVLARERGFPNSQLVETVLEETKAAWIQAGDRLDELMVRIENPDP